MPNSQTDQPEARIAGMALSAWRGDIEDPIADAVMTEPAEMPVAAKSLSTLASELRALIKRDRQSRALRNR